jgi:SWI/SNF-related matrix-associated actin-dependent regulator 1 of chromatin subfamily A
MIAHPRVHIPAPDGLSYMRYQIDGALYASTRCNSINGDDPGLGKTVTAMALANYLDLTPVLIVVPAGVRLQWRTEFMRWRVGNHPVDVVHSCDTWPTGAQNVVIGYDSLHKFRSELRARTWALVIFDEGHYLKNRATRRTREALGYRRPGYDGHIPPIPARKTLFLTGTPIENQPTDAWSMLHHCDPDTWARHSAWARHFNGSPDRWGGYHVENSRNLAELRGSLKPVMIRHTKAQVLPQLPRIRTVSVVLDSDGLTDIVRRESELASLDPGVGTPEFVAMSSLRRELGLAKAPFVAAHLQRYVDAGISVVCFAQHLGVIDAIHEALGVNCVVVTGATSPRRREFNKNAFIGGRVPVFLGQLRACGTGVDGLQHRSSNVVHAELDWVHSRHTQGAARLHRIGQTRGVLEEFLVFDQSFDAQMVDKLIAKKFVTDSLMKGAL